jgi:hypothetical protein
MSDNSLERSTRDGISLESNFSAYPCGMDDRLRWLKFAPNFSGTTRKVAGRVRFGSVPHTIRIRKWRPVTFVASPNNRDDVRLDSTSISGTMLCSLNCSILLGNDALMVKWPRLGVRSFRCHRESAFEYWSWCIRLVQLMARWQASTHRKLLTLFQTALFPLKASAYTCSHLPLAHLEQAASLVQIDQ